jgi:chitin synthase
MNTTEIVLMSIGLSIVVVTLGLMLLSNGFYIANLFTDNTLFFVKKWMFITLLLAINVGGCLVIYYTSSLQIVFGIIVALKAKEVIMSVMFVVNRIINFFKPSHKQDVENSGSPKNIVAFVPIYKESDDDVKRVIDSVLASKVGPHNLLTCVVNDGGDVNTESLIDDKISEGMFWYKSWKGTEVEVRAIVGKRNGSPMLLLTKDTNVGKKDSIIVCNDIFSNELRAPVNEEIKNHIRSMIINAFGNTFEKHDYLFTTDADTQIGDNAIMSLLQTIEDSNATAACGVVNVASSYGNVVWNVAQQAQYMYGQFLHRTNESILNQVLCLPGCISMFSLNMSKEVMKMYSEIPDVEKSELVKSCVQYVGTDRRLTSSIIYTNHDAKVVLNETSHAYTIAPNSLTSYINQRKRWCNNMYFNSLLNIVSPNVIFLNRLFCLIDVFRMSLVYFRLFNTVYFMYLLGSRNYQISMNYIPFVVLLAYPVLCFLVYSLFNQHLRAQFLSVVIGLILNKVMTFVLSPVVFTTMLWNIGAATWTKP